MDQKNNISDYIKRLQFLDKQIDENPDPTEFMEELNSVLNGLSKDIQLDVAKKALTPTLNFMNLSNNPDPDFAHEGDSGFDLRAFVESEVIIDPWRVKTIPTGLYFEVEKGLEIQVRSRSGLAVKNSVFVLNSPGTIDCVTEDTIIKTTNGDLIVKELFESNKREVLSFNEEEFKLESDIIDEMWIVNDVECIKISTHSNSVIVPLTKEIYTKRGWIQAKDLLSDDEILIFD